jgi:ABC-2 type transport system ATP-binding protein
VRPACSPPSVSPPIATAVDGTPSDVDVTSFDGSKIRAHWFPVAGSTAQSPAPTVLMGPGWSLPGDTNVGAVGVLGALNIASLRDAGFNVLTWDPRGFGASEGTVSVNSKDFEGRDVQRLLDWVSGQPVARLDGAGDPRVGMVGGSYGGGIQLVTAAVDCRIDALVPVIAWHSLTTSLYKNDTFKAGWSNILTGSARSRKVDPHVASATASAVATGTLSPEDEAWFRDRGPGDAVGAITVPTLFIQGTVDTLFTLDEAVTNYTILRDKGVPTAMVWFCGGHGVCLTDAGDGARVTRAGIAWLTRYVKDDASAPAAPRVDIVDQKGARFVGDDLPTSSSAITGSGSGTLALSAEGGSGPQQVPAGGDLLAPIVAGITPARATNAVNVVITPNQQSLVAGAPQVTLSYSGSAPAGEKPTRVFAQLIDDTTGLVIGNQVTPIPVTLDGQAHETTVPLEIVAFSTGAGKTVTLQLVATTVSYATPGLGGTVTFSNVTARLPISFGLRAV